MRTQEEQYDERLRRGPSGATVFVRIVYGAVIIMLACVALLMHLQTTAYNRAETAYYHLANILMAGGTPEYDSAEGDGGSIETPESMGLEASDWWKTAATVNKDEWIIVSCELYSPFLERLGIDIQASFPATEMT